MADPIAIKQIKIGENNHDIDAEYWGSVPSSYINELAEKTYVDKKIWYGTEAEYQEAKTNGNIGVGTLVIILNDNELGGNPGNPGGSGGDNAGSSTTAKLGTAILGQMKLGQN